MLILFFQTEVPCWFSVVCISDCNPVMIASDSHNPLRRSGKRTMWLDGKRDEMRFHTVKNRLRLFSDVVFLLLQTFISNCNVAGLAEGHLWESGEAANWPQIPSIILHKNMRVSWPWLLRFLVWFLEDDRCSRLGILDSKHGKMQQP